VKKNRFLRTQKEAISDSNQVFIEDEEFVQETELAGSSEINQDILNTDLDFNDSHTSVNTSTNINTNVTEISRLTLTDKLKYWSLSNITILTNKCISELLNILRSEGYVNLHRIAETLLDTCHVRPAQIMMTKRGNEGSYIYIGIEEALIYIKKE